MRFLLPAAPADAATYTTEIRNRYQDQADAFLARYPAEAMTESMLATTRDALYGWATERLVAKQSSVGARSFLYYFNHGYPAADAADVHAFHSSEIPFAFGTMTSTPPNWPRIPQTPQEQRLSDAMLSYWLTFARDGVPRAAGDADWPPYDRDRTYMAFEDVPRVRSNPTNGFEIHEAVVCRLNAHGGVAWNWNVGVIEPPLPPQVPKCR